jgi:hypothetical protein
MNIKPMKTKNVRGAGLAVGGVQQGDAGRGAAAAVAGCSGLKARLP